MVRSTFWMLPLVLCGLAACGGGGGGGGSPPPGGTVIDFDTVPSTATGGQVLAVVAPSVLFTVGTDFPVQWTAAGVSAATGKARAIGARTLSLLVPMLPTGSYEARVQLSGATGRLPVLVTTAPVVADPPRPRWWRTRSATSQRCETTSWPTRRRCARPRSVNRMPGCVRRGWRTSTASTSG